MAKRHLKRLAARYAAEKKAARFAIKPAPGPHPIARAIPLAAALIQLGFAKVRKEAKVLLAQRAVAVDGKIATDPKRPVGLMDVLNVGESYWRAGLGAKGRIVFEKIGAEDARAKICRVERKTRVRQGVQLTLHDGRTLLNFPAAPGDCVKISIPEGKAIEHIPREVGTRCLITGGARVGRIGEVVEFIERTREARCKAGEEYFTVQKKFLFPIEKVEGKGKA